MINLNEIKMKKSQKEQLNHIISLQKQNIKRKRKEKEIEKKMVPLQRSLI